MTKTSLSQLNQEQLKDFLQCRQPTDQVYDKIEDGYVGWGPGREAPCGTPATNGLIHICERCRSYLCDCKNQLDAATFKELLRAKEQAPNSRGRPISRGISAL